MKTAFKVLLAILLGAAPGWAVLGEYQNSVGVDQKVMRGQVRNIERQGYTVQEVKGADGVVVREYVSPDGMVFGLAWQGPQMPNLTQLLGSYLPDFQQSPNHKVRRRGPLVIHTDRVVIESGGHMRAFSGRAYVPKLIPKSLSAEVVR
jgi:Protein of unknown function (DUF2844)